MSIYIEYMAALGSDQQQSSDTKILPLKWPNKREDYELLEVIGMFKASSVPIEEFNFIRTFRCVVAGLLKIQGIS